MSSQATLLPSHSSAVDLLEGRPGGLVAVIGSTALRAGLIGVGLYAVGQRGNTLAKGAVGGALAIEAFVLWWAWKHS